MRFLLPGLFGLLAACTTVPPAPQPGPPMAYPPSVRDRILGIAAAEWREWGGLVQDDVARGLALGGTARAPLPARLESRPDNTPRLIAYWRSVPRDEGAIARNRPLFAADPAAPPPGLWAEPAWSAAFISYVMLRAGVDTAEFPPDASHARYLDALTDTAAAWPGQAPFLPLSPALAAPAPGDLVCTDRSATPLPDWAARAAEAGRFRPMHCDLVLAVAPGIVAAVGGNVADAVVLTRYAADDRGLLLPRQAGAAPFVVLMRNRLGQLPPFGGPAS